MGRVAGAAPWQSGTDLALWIQAAPDTKNANLDIHVLKSFSKISTDINISSEEGEIAESHVALQASQVRARQRTVGARPLNNLDQRGRGGRLCERAAAGECC